MVFSQSSTQQLPDRIKLPLQFDPQKLKADWLMLESAEWIAHFVKQNYDGDWSVLPLRGPSDARHPIRMAYSDPGCQSFADTPFLAQAAYLQQVLARFQCPLLSVRLMKLSPGSRILEHHDHDLAAELGVARLHIPVNTNPDVYFYLNRKHVRMHEGECWYLRLSDPHAVNNQGHNVRVHLVIDVEVNAWLRSLLENGMA